MTDKKSELQFYTADALDSLIQDLESFKGSGPAALLISEEFANLPDGLHSRQWEFGSSQPELKLSDDGQAAVQVHEYLGTLPPDAASDRRLWSYLAAVKFANYTRIRWKADDKEAASTWMKDRVVITTTNLTRLSRNSIARLWHAADRLVDEDLQYPLTSQSQDKYAYVREVFRKQDFHTAIFQRSIVLNADLIRAILDHTACTEKPREGDYIKKLAIEVLLQMGYQQLRALEYPELQELVSVTSDTISDW